MKKVQKVEFCILFNAKWDKNEDKKGQNSHLRKKCAHSLTDLSPPHQGCQIFPTLGCQIQFFWMPNGFFGCQTLIFSENSNFPLKFSKNFGAKFKI